MPVMDIRRMIVWVNQHDMHVRMSMGAFERDQLVGIGVIVMAVVVTMRMRVLERIVLDQLHVSVSARESRPAHTPCRLPILRQTWLPAPVPRGGRAKVTRARWQQ